jgi:hypothetical protein
MWLATQIDGRYVLVLTMIAVLTSDVGSFQVVERAPAPFLVGRLTSRTVNVTDKSLAEWDRSLLVFEVPPARALDFQLKTINGRAPLLLRKNDAGLVVYMAVNQAFWFIAATVTDDAVVSVDPSSIYPYSGDCLEIFFAGKNLESGADLHDHVSNPRAPSDQAAFLQLDIPAAGLDEPLIYLPDWRTDANIRRGAVKAGFSVNVWRTRTGWNTEARIPLAVFESEVRASIQKHVPLKMNIDYLDYDRAIAPRTPAGFQGFNPDNVIALDRQQERLSVPRLMRAVTFQ